MIPWALIFDLLGINLIFDLSLRLRYQSFRPAAGFCARSNYRKDMGQSLRCRLSDLDIDLWSQDFFRNLIPGKIKDKTSEFGSASSLLNVGTSRIVWPSTASRLKSRAFIISVRYCFRLLQVFKCRFSFNVMLWMIGVGVKRVIGISTKFKTWT